MKGVYKRTITYQVGVDVLGFPIYVQHDIYQDNPLLTERRGKDKGKGKWLTVLSSLLKQH